jgi:hypothetical protein
MDPNVRWKVSFNFNSRIQEEIYSSARLTLLAPGGQKITSDKRIKASLPTIKYALEHGAGIGLAKSLLAKLATIDAAGVSCGGERG